MVVFVFQNKHRITQENHGNSACFQNKIWSTNHEVEFWFFYSIYFVILT